MEKERIYYFDNLKALLIFLVVFGHFNNAYIMDTLTISKYVINFIYLFHMPLFVFVSGYFSKGKDKNIFITFYLPFLIFNSLYAFLYRGDLSLVNPFNPIFSYWYLVSLMFWKLSISYLNKIKFIIPLSVILSIVLGGFYYVIDYVSFARTICFLPFFLIGYNFKKEWITKIKSIKKRYIFSLVVLFCILFIFGIKNEFIFHKLLLRNFGFEYLNISTFRGILLNCFVLFLTFLSSFLILYFVPKKKNPFSYLGRNTMFIYLFHPFIYLIIPKLILYINKYCDMDLVVIFFLIILFSILVTLILGCNLFTKTYNKVMKVIEKRILISDKQ